MSADDLMSVNKPAVSQVVENSIQDNKNVVPIVDQITPTTKDLTDVFVPDTPFDDVATTNVLERQYQVFKTSVGAGFTPFALSFPGLLLAVPTIQDNLKTFSLFRAGVRVTVKLTSTLDQAGALVVSYLPCTNVAVGPISATGNKGVILNYSTSDSCVIEIPYTFVFPWLTKDSVFDIGTLYINELLPLLAPTTSSQTITIQAFASFVNMKVAGPIVPQSESEKRSRGVASTVLSPVIETATKALLDSDLLGFLDKPDASCSLRRIETGSFLNTSLTNTDGVVPSTSLSLKPGPLLPNNFRLFSGGSSNMRFSTIAQTPMYHANAEFLAEHDSLTIKCYPSFQPLEVPDYLKYVADRHVWYRGSIKYLLMFVTDRYTAAKFAITYSKGPYNPSLDQGSGDVYTRYLDVQGTAITTVSVPYLEVESWFPTEPDPDFMTAQLTVSLISDVQGTNVPSVPTIRLLVFRAGGEDIQFSEPYYPWGAFKSKEDTKTPPVKKAQLELDILLKDIKPQCSLVQTFRAEFDPTKVPANPKVREYGVCMTEVSSTPGDLVKRFSGYSPFLPQDILPKPLFNKHSVEWSRLFMFWRGSRRVAVLDYDPSTVGTLLATRVDVSTTDVVSQVGNIAYPEFVNPNPESQFYTVPFQTNRPFLIMPGRRGAGNNIPYRMNGMYANATAHTFYAYAAGDDFCFGHLVAPGTFTS